ncbi:putative pentatricopeptide repeat domain-containing protein [Erysiphe neolycopersici]|uniref:Putative pentatricopeptide repeat domain-containing protein n=1 Tax=Erysiphe neolycopersici TaxID=212602 RepID=A0A420I4N1_9PEZI|nr:putative pentatricopeptide repeat domain-containing protein [Erysiphe neolycopersici]
MFRGRGSIWCYRKSIIHSYFLTSTKQRLFLKFQWTRGSATSSKVTRDSYIGITKSIPPDDLDDRILIKKILGHQKFNSLKSLDSKLNQDDIVLHKDVIIKKVISNLRSIQEHKKFCVKARQAYYDNRIQEGRWIPSWHDIEEILLRETQTLGPTLNGVIQINIPPAWSNYYLCSVDDFLIEIGKIYNCTVELACPDEYHIYTNFNISGPEISVRKFLAFLMETTPYIKATRILIPQTLVRYVSSERRRSKLPAHMLSQPEKWTPISLLEYVEDLTAYDPSSHLLRFVHPPLSSDKSNYCDCIMNILRKLIDSPITSSVFSRLAFHRAMNYFLRKNRLEYIRELYHNMKYIGIKCTTETYNIMLRASAIKEDYHSFHFILNMMLRDGFRPDGRTWIAFIMAVPNHEIKYNLLNKMKERNLLTKTKTLQDVVEQLVEYDLLISINKGQDHSVFLDEMNSRYGSKWLSVDVANRILTIYGRHLLTDRAIDFLDYMEKCSVYLDTWSINILLHSCSLSPSPLLAFTKLMSLKKFRELLEPHQETSRILFKMARMTRSYNMAKVVWRYACLSATTTSRMRYQVSQSLKKSLSPEKDHRNLIWGRDIGCIVLGPRKQQHPIFLTSKTSSKAFVDQGSSHQNFKSSKSSDENYIEELINFDLQIFKYWRPSNPFGETLWLALKLDLVWKEQGFFGQKDLSWFIDNTSYLQISHKYGEFNRVYWC